MGPELATVAVVSVVGVVALGLAAFVFGGNLVITRKGVRIRSRGSRR